MPHKLQLQVYLSSMTAHYFWHFSSSLCSPELEVRLGHQVMMIVKSFFSYIPFPYFAIDIDMGLLQQDLKSLSTHRIKSVTPWLREVGLFCCLLAVMSENNRAGTLKLSRSHPASCSNWQATVPIRCQFPASKFSWHGSSFQCAFQLLKTASQDAPLLLSQ